MSPGKPRNPAGSRDARLEIRLTDAELARLRREAAAAKLYLAEYIRRKLLPAR